MDEKIHSIEKLLFVLHQTTHGFQWTTFNRRWSALLCERVCPKSGDKPPPAGCCIRHCWTSQCTYPSKRLILYPRLQSQPLVIYRRPGYRSRAPPPPICFRRKTNRRYRKLRDYRKSDYAINKYSPNIVYRFHDEIIEVSLEDYLKENPDKTGTGLCGAESPV